VPARRQRRRPSAKCRCAVVIARHAAVEDIGSGHVELLIEVLVGIIVDGDDGAIERKAREHAAAAGVGIDLGLEVRIGRCRGIAAHGTCGHRGIATEGDLATADALDALGRGEHQHDVGRLHAPLPAEAAAGHADEHRVGEASLAVAHHQHTASVAAAGEEGHLGEIRDDRNAVGALEQAIGNPLVRGAAQLLEHLAGDEKLALLARGLRGHGGGGAGEGEGPEQAREQVADGHDQGSPS
jgi:hypothetical protein